MISESTRILRSTCGYSLIELLVGISIFGIVALAGLPHIDTRREGINTAVQQVVSDLRWARARSITSGDHYAVALQGSRSYQVQRLTLTTDGDWQVTSVVKTVQLPSQIKFYFVEVVPERVEFNTRGMMISHNEPLWPVIADLQHKVEHRLTVWPSGQIYVED